MSLLLDKHFRFFCYVLANSIYILATLYRILNLRSKNHFRDSVWSMRNFPVNAQAKLGPKNAVLEDLGNEA